MRQRKSTKWTLALMAMALLLTGGSLLYARLRPPRVPDLQTITPDQAIATMSTENFNRLSTSQRVEFANAVFEKMRTGSPDDRKRWLASDKLSESQKDRLRSNRRLIFFAMILEQARSYRDLPPEKREAYLDAMMEGWSAMRGFRGDKRKRGGEIKRGDQKKRGEGSWRSRNPEKMENHIRHRMAESDPSDRAMILQFFKAMKQQRENQ